MTKELFDELVALSKKYGVNIYGCVQGDGMPVGFNCADVVETEEAIPVEVAETAEIVEPTIQDAEVVE